MTVYNKGPNHFQEAQGRSPQGWDIAVETLGLKRDSLCKEVGDETGVMGTLENYSRQENSTHTGVVQMPTCYF